MTKMEGRPAQSVHVAGHIALILVAMLLTIPYLPKPIGHYKELLGFVVLACVLIFGVMGIKYGRGIGRCAAWLALAVLSVTMLASVVISGVDALRNVAPGGR